MRPQRSGEACAAQLLELCFPDTRIAPHDMGLGGYELDLIRCGDSEPYAALEVTTASGYDTASRSMSRHEVEPPEDPFWHLDEDLGELELMERPSGPDT